MLTHTNRWLLFRKPRSATRERTIGGIALSVTVVAASTYSAFAKVLSGALSPLSLFFVSEVVILLALFFSFGFMPMLKKLLHIKKRMIRPLLLIGLTSGTLAPLLIYKGLETSTAVNASLFGNSEIAFLIILAVLVLREKFTRIHALSVLAMTAGTIVIALQGFSVGMSFYMGDVLLILAGVVFAVGGITYRKHLHHCPPEIPLLVRSLVALTVFFLLSPFSELQLIAEIKSFPLTLIAPLLGFALIARLLNVFSFYESIDRLPVTTVSLCLNLTLVLSVLFAHFYVGEAIAFYHIAGGLLIVAGTVVLEFAGIHPSLKHHRGHLHQRQVQRV